MSDFTVFLSPSDAEKQTFVSLKNIFDAIGVKHADLKEQGENESFENNEGNVTVLGHRHSVAYANYHRPEAIFGLLFPNASHYFRRSQLLNHDAVVMEYKDIDWGSNEYFVKPHTSEGQVKSGELFKSGIYSSTTQPGNGCRLKLVEVSEPKVIKYEYRAFILNGEVIGTCQYAINGNMAIIPNVPQDVADYFKQCAQYAPHTYVLDVARTENDELKIIEMNTFNSSGLMGIDLYKFALALKQHLSTLQPQIFDLTIALPYAKSHEEALKTLHTCRAYTFSQAVEHLKHHGRIPPEVVTSNGIGAYYAWGSPIYRTREVAKDSTEHWYNTSSPNFTMNHA